MQEETKMILTGSPIPGFLCDDHGMTKVEFAVAGLMVALAVVLVFAQLTMTDILEWCIWLFQPL
jgi:Flp pilus assembly pilin Flp